MNWIDHQLTKEQANAVYDIVEGEDWPAATIIRFQLFQQIRFGNPFHYVDCLKKVLRRGHLNALWVKTKWSFSEKSIYLSIRI